MIALCSLERHAPPCSWLQWPNCTSQVISGVGHPDGYIRPKAKTNSLAKELSQIAMPNQPYIISHTGPTVCPHDLIPMNNGRRHRQSVKAFFEPLLPEPPSQVVGRNLHLPITFWLVVSDKNNHVTLVTQAGDQLPFAIHTAQWSHRSD